MMLTAEEAYGLEFWRETHGLTDTDEAFASLGLLYRKAKQQGRADVGKPEEERAALD